MTALLWLSLLGLFSFFLAFLISLIKLVDWNFPQTKGRRRTWLAGSGNDNGVLRCFKHRHTFKERLKQVDELSNHKSCLFTKNTASCSPDNRGTACLVTYLTVTGSCLWTHSRAIYSLKKDLLHTRMDGYIWALPSILFLIKIFCFLYLQFIYHNIWLGQVWHKESFSCGVWGLVLWPGNEPGAPAL